MVAAAAGHYGAAVSCWLLFTPLLSLSPSGRDDDDDDGQKSR